MCELEDPTEGRWWGVTQEDVWGKDDSPKGLVVPNVIQGQTTFGGVLDGSLSGTQHGHQRGRVTLGSPG